MGMTDRKTGMTDHMAGKTVMEMADHTNRMIEHMAGKTV